MNASPSQSAVKLPRILVVDDMPDNLFLMNGLFEDHYEVVQALSGREALKVVMSDNPPDMVLLDIMMPDMDGYEVLRRIRQHAPTANVPVVFLTALGSKQDERLGMDLGAIDYLTKPVDPDLVMRRVEANLRASAQARRLEALSEKLSRQLSPARWQELFHGAELEAIRFEQKVQTVLHAEAGEVGCWSERERDRFVAEVEWLAVRHQGTVDRFIDGATAIHFDEPGAAVRMAMDLQRSAGELHMRIGIHTGVCDIGVFRSANQSCSTLIGPAAGAAARMAEAASTGSIAISAETYALAQDDVEADRGGYLLSQEFDGNDLSQVCITPAPERGTAELSTFAGLSPR